MASTISFDCPVCSLPMEATTVTPEEGARNGHVGGHIHMEVSGTVACLNAHRWTASGAFLLKLED